MNYFIGVGGIALFQAAISYGTMLAGTGNGSFVGLAAMLFAIMGIPTTAFLNFIFMYENRKHPERPYRLRMFLVSAVLPVVQIALFILVKLYRI